MSTMHAITAPAIRHNAGGAVVCAPVNPKRERIGQPDTGAGGQGIQ